MKTINKYLLEKLIISKDSTLKSWQSKLIDNVEKIFSYNKAYTNKFSQIIDDFLNTDKYKKCQGKYYIIASNFYEDHFFNYYDGKDCVANFLNDMEYDELSEIFDDNQFEYSYSNSKKYKNNKYDIDLYIKSGIIAINGSKNGYSDEDSYVSILLVPKIDAHLPKEVSEKLVINSKSKLNETNVYKIPVVDFHANDIDINNVWKELRLPEKQFVIYKDKYRRNHAHFATFDDMLTSIMYNEDDFEDFNVKDDILYASDDLKEILNWYFKNIYNIEAPTKKINRNDWIHRVDNTYAYDQPAVLFDIYIGDDDYYNGPGIKFNNPKETIEKIINNIA